MTNHETERPAVLSGRKIAIVAGSGALPEVLADELEREGNKPVLIAIKGEADRSVPARADAILDIEALGGLPKLLKGHGVRHVVFAGGVSRRPKWYRIRLTFGLLRLLPRGIRALGAGDDALLRIVTTFMENEGITVVGAHEIMPRLLCPEGTLGAVTPGKDDWTAITAGFKAARAIGALDIGQAAVAFGRRAIALEGIEGTEGLLERTRDMRNHGRLTTTRRGVLVKCAKPGQDERADLPSIGPQTVISAHAAGLSGIAVEAGRSLLLEAGRIREEADRLGLYVVGVREDML
ncbi:LpxI family protein [Zhengella sp. ZM62]|uniref:LpxI family protein n=1 Tax=Zhengella sedimenti TaxID=3390035 RepID=UPI003976FB6C